MKEMSLREKIGQRLVVGFPGFEMTKEYIELVREYKVGNVILFAENVESALQLKTLCDSIQELTKAQTGYPAFITIDQEGGVVTRLHEKFAAVVPGAMAIAATGDPQNAYIAGKLTAQELLALGVNFDLAPDMDINSNANNPVIGVRSYGDSPETVSAYGVQMIRGLLDGGVLCTAKHFPGHGDTEVDSHLSLPKVDKTMEELEKCELAPFRAAIQAGVPSVMTTHILFPQIEPERIPATMSRRIITGLLKERLGFRGLVISDCMMMNAIQEEFGTVNGSVAAVAAGVDLVFVSHSVELARQACEALEQKLKSGGLSMDEMNASVQSILEYKQKVSGHVPAPLSVVGCRAHRETVRKLMEDAITPVQVPAGGLPPLGDRPIVLGCYPFRPTIASNPEMKELSFADYLSKKLGADSLITPVDPDEHEIDAILEKAKGHSCIVAGTYNGHIKKGQLALVRALDKLNIPLVCVALRNPYDLRDLPSSVYALAAYSYDENSLNAVARVLRREIEPHGKLSVRL